MINKDDRKIINQDKEEWIGERPFHWGKSPLKKFVDFKKGKDSAKYTKEYMYEFRGEYPVYSGQTANQGVMGYLKSYDYNIDECLFTTTVGAKAMTISYLKGKFSLSQNCLIMTKKSNIINLKFIYYFLIPLFNYEKALIPSHMQPSLRISDLKSYSILEPPLKEQNFIVKFLDTKTSEIDALISDKEKLIALLEEKRQAIITEAVTKGLDPDVKMKDSGVEWIGEIPDHWNMKKLRFLGRFQNGISKSAEYFGHGSPFVSYGDVYNNFELPIAVNGLVDSTQLEKEAYSVKPGDVFFTRTSETVDEIGLASTCMKSIEGATFAGFLIRFRPFTGKLVPQFSKFYFRNQLSRKYFVKEMNIVTRASLGQNLLKNYPVILPPVTEQKTIANYLESMNEQTDKLIQENKYIIEKLKEYRQALIYEAVTGKIDVQEMLKETEQEEVSSS